MTPTTDDLQLTTPVGALDGVTPEQAAALLRLGIRCVADLILHLPMRYEDQYGRRSIAEIADMVGPEHGAAISASVEGEVHRVESRRFGRRRVQAQLFDETGTLRLLWFNQSWVAKRLHPGVHIRAEGVIKRHGDELQLVNSRWRAIDPENPQAETGDRYAPVYPATEGIDSRTIDRITAAVLDRALERIDDHLPAEFCAERAIPRLADAYRMVHRPTNDDDVLRGRRRLAYDEFFLLQLGVMLKRAHRLSGMNAIPLRHNDEIDQRVRARIPFELTASQNVVISEIVRDLQRSMPMNRLLQGDVGSGKTVVALFAMLVAIANGKQAALMAPTELLAEQHASTISQFLEGSRVQSTVLTGSVPPRIAQERRERIEGGDVDLIIGTHALLSETVRFNDLAVVVIDEQHRFGVMQRAVLRSRSGSDLQPHALVMTATPIPRTLSLTVFGDLDVSTIRGLPPGRMPIVTRVLGSGKRDHVYQFVARRLRGGDQAYIVVPVIDESDSGLTSVETHLEWLGRDYLSPFRVAAMHGRLDRETRDQLMREFRDGKIDALVATTVIEVGVDVPNASIMVIEQADRFGLAQLHQLRGRVGRGSRRSVCVLIGEATTPDGEARLAAIGETTNGFEIAEKDFEIRGPGELFGARQSGVAPFRVAELPHDLPLLQVARKDASDWIDRHPGLAGDDQELLRRRLWKAYGQTLGLGDVA